MKFRSALCFVSFIALSLPACLQAEPELPLTIEKAWIRAVPPVASDTAAYMVLTNTGKKTLRLTGGSTPIARMVHPMITTRKTQGGKEIFGMELVEALEIPGGGRAVLAPRGDHVMIMKMTCHPKAGEKVQLTLHFEPGSRKVTLEVPVLNSEPKS